MATSVIFPGKYPVPLSLSKDTVTVCSSQFPKTGSRVQHRGAEEEYEMGDTD